MILRNATFFVTGTHDEIYKFLNNEIGLERDGLIPEGTVYAQMTSFYDEQGDLTGGDPANVIILFFDKALNPIPGSNINL